MKVGAVHDRGGTVKEAFEAAPRSLSPTYGRWPIFEHCLPFDVTPALGRAQRHRLARIWTAERDREVWDAAAGLIPSAFQIQRSPETDMNRTAGDVKNLFTPSSTPSTCRRSWWSAHGPVGQNGAPASPVGDPGDLLDGRPERDNVGSKAMCQARDVLDIWDTVGAGRSWPRRA